MSVYRKIIVAVDFSPANKLAVDTAVELGTALGAQVVLVHVQSPNTEKLANESSGETVQQGLEQQLQKLVESYRALEPKALLDWGLVNGAPAEELKLFAERWGGDLLVLGTNGRSGVARMLMGSVAQAVVQKATVPVLVVPTKH